MVSRGLGFLLPAPSGRSIVFPPPVQPPVLFRRLADHFFEFPRIPLRQLSHAVNFVLYRSRVDDRRKRQFKMHRPPEPAAMAHTDQGIMIQG